MLKYPCLVLDHDDTVVQSMKTLSYPFFCYVLEQFRPGQTMTEADYIIDCHNLGFMELCRQRFGFSEKELEWEHEMWSAYIRTHTPATYPGMDRIIRRQKAEGGMLCVISHSAVENITRDYDAHFGMQPDAIYAWDLPPQRRKPNPWPLQNLMGRFGFSPGEILVVDDMKLSCLMAEPLGVATAYAGWNGLGVPEIEDEMTGRCDFSFHSTEELEKFLFE